MHQSQLYVQPSAEMQEQMEEAADRYSQARVPADVNNIPRVSWKPYLNTGEWDWLFISAKNDNLPICDKWNSPLVSSGPVHFHFKGCWVLFFIFFQILIEHSVSKQWRPWSDAAFCGV